MLYAFLICANFPPSPLGGTRQSDWHQFIQVRGFPGDLAGRTVFLWLGVVELMLWIQLKIQKNHSMI